MKDTAVDSMNLSEICVILLIIACILDMITNSKPNHCPENWTLICTQVECAKQLLITLFQMANLLLLLASIVESPILVQLYVWYTLAFVVLGLIVNIVDFLFKYKLEGTSCLIGFVTEVCFLFVPFLTSYLPKFPKGELHKYTAISRCLPLVDTYRKHIDGESSITT